MLVGSRESGLRKAAVAPFNIVNVGDDGVTLLIHSSRRTVSRIHNGYAKVSLSQYIKTVRQLVVAQFIAVIEHLCL